MKEDGGERVAEGVAAGGVGCVHEDAVAAGVAVGAEVGLEGLEVEGAKAKGRVGDGS